MEQSKLSPYRWVIEVLMFLAFVAQTMTWLAPAPILNPIIKSLHISLGSAGLIISVIALCISIFSLLGALVSERLGALRAFLLGLWLLAIGQILSSYCTTFGALLLCRVIQGVGFGIMIAPPGTLTMQWFGEGEWPWINMINALCAYIGLTAVYSLTAPLFLSLGSSWQRVVFAYGIAVAGVALLWTILGRERHAIRAVEPVANAPAQGSTLLEVIKMRDVRLLAGGLFGGMWVFQLYTAFLPEYFHTIRGMDLRAASSMTAVLPITGMFASLGGGIGTGITGLRKPFTWPVAITTLLGCAGAISMTDPIWIRVSLVLVGIGAAGSLAAITTLLMELPGMTPAKMGTGLAFMWSVGYSGAFVAPFLGGVLAAHYGLKAVMLGFLAFQFMPIVAMYFLPETGPGRARYEIAPAAGAASITTSSADAAQP
ncbi:MAG: transporter, family, D-galactonate transporter [Candidatus Binataceae bacterium]|nr:transporter, family, D-galactonate transporter [Candidatus Binataceae bacterium]